MHVNLSYNGYERGTAAEPMSTLIGGLFAARRGGTLYLEPGPYIEVPQIQKAIVIRTRPGTSGPVTLGRP